LPLAGVARRGKAVQFAQYGGIAFEVAAREPASHDRIPVYAPLEERAFDSACTRRPEIELRGEEFVFVEYPRVEAQSQPAQVGGADETQAGRSPVAV